MVANRFVVCIKPQYPVAADAFFRDDEEHTIKGVTLTAVGFYGPQGRVLRLPLAMPGINDRITAFRYEGYKVTNYEMESAAITGLCNSFDGVFFVIQAVY